MHNAVFKEELGCVQGIAKPQATPKFCKARTVPYALRGRVEQELEQLHESSSR